MCKTSRSKSYYFNLCERNDYRRNRRFVEWQNNLEQKKMNKDEIDIGKYFLILGNNRSLRSTHNKVTADKIARFKTQLNFPYGGIRLIRYASWSQRITRKFECSQNKILMLTNSKYALQKYVKNMSLAFISPLLIRLGQLA